MQDNQVIKTASIGMSERPTTFNDPKPKRPMFEHEMLEIMRQMNKNIPFTREQIESLPLGFSPTAQFHTKSWGRTSSKFLKENQYNIPKN